LLTLTLYFPLAQTLFLSRLDFLPAVGWLRYFFSRKSINIKKQRHQLSHPYP